MYLLGVKKTTRVLVFFSSSYRYFKCRRRSVSDTCGHDQFKQVYHIYVELGRILDLNQPLDSSLSER